MDNIKLRQIKITPPDGKKLTDEEVKRRIRRAQELMDFISGVFSSAPPKRSKKQKGVDIKNRYASLL